MSAIDLGGLPYSQIGQLQIRSRSGTIPSTIPRIGGWAVDPVAECAFVEDAGLAVPSTAVSIGALKYTPDGALYVTADTTTGPFTNIGGLKVRQDGAACIITKTPSVTLDPYIGGAAYDGATSAMVVGGAGFGFILPLVTTIRPTAGVGGATFTRATTATVEDWETVVRPVLSSEVRFQGARRVRNLFTFSQDQTNAVWNKTSAVVTSGFADPQGGTGACRVVGTGVWGVDQSLTAGASLVSLWVKSNTGLNQTFRIRRAGAASSDVTATTEWKRVSDLGGASAGNVNGILRDAANNNVDILVYAFQFEDTTGQSNTNPSEYVSVGVLSAPFHGANVDGVKYFATQNGNTVASNVVTEATGAVLSASIIKGYLAEGARTNLCLQSQDYSNASWTKTDTTITADALTAPDGTLTADLATEGVAGTAMINQVITATADVSYTTTRWFKVGNTPWVQVQLANGANFAIVWFNVSTGAVGAATVLGGTGTVVAKTIQAYPNGWYRCTFTGTVGSGATAIRVQFSSASADGNQTRVNGATFNIWGDDFEVASFPSSYIPTTTVAVTRNADVLTYASAGNVLAAQGSVYAEIRPLGTIVGTEFDPLTLDSTGLQFFIGAGGGQMFAKNRADVTQVGGAVAVSNTVNKWAASWLVGGNLSFVQDGSAKGTAVQTTTPTITTISVGSSNGASHLFGTIKNVMISQSQLTDAQLAALTA